MRTLCYVSLCTTSVWPRIFSQHVLGYTGPVWSKILITFYIPQWTVENVITKTMVTPFQKNAQCVFMYQSKWLVTRTSELGCPIDDDVSSRLWHLQIGIECNIVIITDIYITSATSVPLSFWFFSAEVRSQQIFLLIIYAYTTAHTIDALPSAKISFYETG